MRTVAVSLLVLVCSGCGTDTEPPADKPGNLEASDASGDSELIGMPCAAYVDLDRLGFDADLLLSAEYIVEEEKCYVQNPPRLERTEFGCGELLITVDQEVGSAEDLAEALNGVIPPRRSNVNSKDYRCRGVLIRVPPGTEREALQKAWQRPEVVLLSLNYYAVVELSAGGPATASNTRLAPARPAAASE